MENKFYKVFCGALIFGIVAMILLTLVIIKSGNCCYGPILLFMCIVFAGGLSVYAYHNFVEYTNKKFDKDVEKKSEENVKTFKERLEAVEKLKTDAIKQAEKENQQKLLMHEERMMLLKQADKVQGLGELLKLMELDEKENENIKK